MVSGEWEHVETKQTSTMTDLTRTDEVCRPVQQWSALTCADGGRVPADNCPKRSDPFVSVTFDRIISIVGSLCFLENWDVVVTRVGTGQNVT